LNLQIYYNLYRAQRKETELDVGSNPTTGIKINN